MSLTQPNQNVDPAAPANEPGVIGASQTPVAQPQNQQIPYTPEQILELEQYAIATTRRLKEYEEDPDFKRLKDPEYKTFWHNAVEYYENGKKAGQPVEGQNQPSQRVQLDPETQEVIEYVRETRNRETASQRAEYERWLAEQRVAEQRMRRDYGLNDEQIGVLAEVADAEAKRTGKRVGFEQAYSRINSFKPGAGNMPPTVGLRGDSSMPGVPGPSLQSNEDFKKDFHGTLTARIRAGQ